MIEINGIKHYTIEEIKQNENLKARVNGDEPIPKEFKTYEQIAAEFNISISEVQSIIKHLNLEPKSKKGKVGRPKFYFNINDFKKCYRGGK